MSGTSGGNKRGAGTLAVAPEVKQGMEWDPEDQQRVGQEETEGWTKAGGHLNLGGLRSSITDAPPRTPGHINSYADGY